MQDNHHKVLMSRGNVFGHTLPNEQGQNLHGSQAIDKYRKTSKQTDRRNDRVSDYMVKQIYNLKRSYLGIINYQVWLLNFRGFMGLKPSSLTGHGSVN